MKNMQKLNMRHPIRAFLVPILCLALLCGCLTGCKKSGAPADNSGSGKKLTAVTLNEVAHSVFYAPMYVAVENGYFEEEGIDLTLVTGFGAV